MSDTSEDDTAARYARAEAEDAHAADYHAGLCGLDALPSTVGLDAQAFNAGVKLAAGLQGRSG